MGLVPGSGLTGSDSGTAYRPPPTRKPAPPSNNPWGQISAAGQGAVDAAQAAFGFYAPTFAGIDQHNAWLNTQLLNQPGQTQQNAGFLSQNNALAQQLLGLQGQSNQVDIAGTGRQQDYYNNLFGLDQKSTAQNIGYQNALKGFLDQSFGVTTGQHQSVLAQLQNAASQNRFQAGVDTRQSNSQSTAAGAFTSQGHRQGLQDIQSQLAYALNNNAQQTKQENLGFDQAGIDLAKNKAGIDNTISNLSTDLERSGLTTQEQIARLNDRRSQLEIQAQTYGVQSDQLAAQLTQGLAKLQLDQMMNTGQLMDALNSNNAQAAQVVNQIIQFAVPNGAAQAKPKKGN